MVEFFSILRKGRLDLRISTYPTLYGEKTVLRLLNISDALHSFNGLGFEPECEERFNSMLIGGEGDYIGIRSYWKR